MAASGVMQRAPAAAGQMLIALDLWLGPLHEIVIVGGVHDLPVRETLSDLNRRSCRAASWPVRHEQQLAPHASLHPLFSGNSLGRDTDCLRLPARHLPTSGQRPSAGQPCGRSCSSEKRDYQEGRLPPAVPPHGLRRPPSEIARSQQKSNNSCHSARRNLPTERFRSPPLPTLLGNIDRRTERIPFRGFQHSVARDSVVRSCASSAAVSHIAERSGAGPTRRNQYFALA